MITTTTIRIDTVLYDTICQQAIKDNRSINAEICYILKQYLEMIKWNNKK